MTDQAQIEFALAKMRRNEVPGLSMCTIVEHFDALQERFDWLETQQGSALVSDDHSRWAVVTDGVQNNPGNKPTDIHTTFFIRASEWKPSICEAIDAARAAYNEGSFGGLPE